MLSHHAASRAALSVLQTGAPAAAVAAAAALEGSEFFRLGQHRRLLRGDGGATRRPYSTSVSSKQPWAAATRSRPAAASSTNQLRQRRPIVNGESVAFHVSDLLRRASPPPPPFPPPRAAPPLSAPPSSSVPFVSGSLNGLGGPSYPSNSPAVSAPASSRYESDLVVILDMDECLIHSQFLSPQNAQFFAYQLLKQQGKTHRFSTAASPGGGGDGPQQQQQPKRVDTIRFTLPDGDLVHVNLRPGLPEFLRAVSAKYETHVFTAAMSVYADPLLDQLDPAGAMLSGRWYREHCSYDPARQAYVKDLGRLAPLLRRSAASASTAPSAGPPLSRVVLVDNNPLSFLANPSNGILVSSFYNDPSDTSLQDVWRLLQDLDRQDDVRPHLDRRFGLRAALAKLGEGGGKQQQQEQPPPPRSPPMQAQSA